MKGFTIQHRKKKLALMPTEDAFAYTNGKRRIAVVADGVTRDPWNYLPDTKTFFGQIMFALTYPRIKNPAGVSARGFCESALDNLRNEGYVDEEAMKRTFLIGNEAVGVGGLERFRNFDYLKRDFPGCVAATVAEEDGSMHWGYICDSGAAVVSAKGDLKFRTENDGPDKHNGFFWPKIREKWRHIKKCGVEEVSWRWPEVRREIRSRYRNNPSEPHSFGVLTGEKDAMYYVRTGTRELLEGDAVLVYTDGVQHVLFKDDGDIRGDFADKVRERDEAGIEKLCRQGVKTEGTLVYYFSE